MAGLFRSIRRAILGPTPAELIGEMGKSMAQMIRAANPPPPGPFDHIPGLSKEDKEWLERQMRHG